MSPLVIPGTVMTVTAYDPETAKFRMTISSETGATAIGLAHTADLATLDFAGGNTALDDPEAMIGRMWRNS